MDIGEIVTQYENMVAEKLKCPFQEEGKKEETKGKSDENLSNEDLDAAQEMQDNDGGILGTNLTNGRKGEADGGPYSQKGDIKDYLIKENPEDTKRGRLKLKIGLDSYKDIESDDFPFSVAAHHLIPGNAALYSDQVDLLIYMEKGKNVTSLSGRKLEIKDHIGYDVNGAHNGVWLPGNYAIRKAQPSKVIKKDGKKIKIQAVEGTTPKEGLSWGDLDSDYEKWQYDYVAGACKVAGRQFHDSHERPYSANVRKYLNKLALALAFHLDFCEECKNRTKVPPPYNLKICLYLISNRLRQYVTGPPSSWKNPWFTSERWSDKFFCSGHITREFLDAYNKAYKV